MKTFALLISLLALFVCGCRHTNSATLVAEFGQPGPGKIAIFINGNIEHPGRYHINDGATLISILDLLGGFRACEACGFTPSRVHVFSQQHPKEQQRYLLSNTNDLQAVLLRDGDRVTFVTIHL